LIVSGIGKSCNRMHRPMKHLAINLVSRMWRAVAEQRSALTFYQHFESCTSGRRRVNGERG
jgi:hypothetical protein